MKKSLKDASLASLGLVDASSHLIVRGIVRPSLGTTAGKKLIIFEKAWITETREEVYIAELICQVSKVYDYPRQMRGNPIKSAITVG